MFVIEPGEHAAVCSYMKYINTQYWYAAALPFSNPAAQLQRELMIN